MGWVCIALVTCAAGCGFTKSVGTSATTDGGDREGMLGEEAGVPGAWLTPWTRRKAVTIRASQIPDTATLTDFPVLVSIVDPDLATTAQPLGTDIVFTGADGMLQLKSEIEDYASGTLVAWVKVPSLSAVADTRLYMYYGNASPPAQPPTQDVWTHNFYGVWHLHQDPGPGGADEIRDATNTRHGTASAQMAAADRGLGQVGPALAFNGSDKYVDFAALDVGNNFTISVWARTTATAAGFRTLFANSVGGFAIAGFRLFVNDQNGADGRVYFETGNGAQGQNALTGTGAVPANEWKRVDAVVERLAGRVSIYVDGMRRVTNGAIRNDFLTNSDFEVARMKGGNYFQGQLDQVELASELRSTEWIETSFNNQKQPSAFQSVGAEERP